MAVILCKSSDMFSDVLNLSELRTVTFMPKDLDRKTALYTSLPSEEVIESS